MFVVRCVLFGHMFLLFLVLHMFDVFAITLVRLCVVCFCVVGVGLLSILLRFGVCWMCCCMCCLGLCFSIGLVL